MAHKPEELQEVLHYTCLLYTSSTFMNGLKKAGVELNRKMLSEMAIHDPASFNALVETAKKAL